MRVLLLTLLFLTTAAHADECDLKALGKAQLEALHRVFKGPTGGPLFFANHDVYRQASDAYQYCLRSQGSAPWSLLENPKPAMAAAELPH